MRLPETTTKSSVTATPKTSTGVKTWPRKTAPDTRSIPKLMALAHKCWGTMTFFFHVHHVFGWFWMWEKTCMRFRFYAHESSRNFGAPLVKTHGFLFPSIPWDPRWAWNPCPRSIGSAPFVPKFCCATTCHSIQSVPVIWTIQSWVRSQKKLQPYLSASLKKCGTPIGSLVNSHNGPIGAAYSCPRGSCVQGASLLTECLLPTFQRWLSFIMIYHELELQN